MDREALYVLLRAREIPFEEVTHPAVWNMEELHALRLPGEERILKNLFLRDDKKRRYYLVSLDGGQTADLKALRQTLNSRPLSFAGAADLERLLGLQPGQVTPLGALRAPAGTVTVVLDASLRGQTVGVHPLENTATIFLSLDDLAALREGGTPLDDERLADGLAASLEQRTQMLKLLAMNLYDIEQNSRLESLVAFKHAYKRAMSELEALLRACKPQWGESRLNRFVFGLMPYTHGVYPFVFHSEKQCAAMDAANVAQPELTVRALVRDLALKLLRD